MIDGSYRAFLLRLWQEQGSQQWRITLEDAHTGHRQGFRSIDDFVAFLRSSEPHDSYNSSTQGNGDE